MVEDYKAKLENLSKIEKVSATSAVLLAASFFIGSECKQVNDDYMICNSEIVDPEKCLEKGIQVSKCVNNM